MNFQINFLTMFLQDLLKNRPATCLTVLTVTDLQKRCEEFLYTLSDAIVLEL